METIEIDFSKCAQISRDGPKTLLQDLKSGKKFICKKIEITHDVNFSVWKRDIERRCTLFHSNVVQIFLYAFETPKIYDRHGLKKGLAHVIFENFSKDLDRELKRNISTNNFWTEEELMNTVEACLAGLRYLHTNGIYHGDLKSKNIVFTDDGELKIADAFVQENYFSLDFSTKLQRWNSFLPPECLTGGIYDGFSHDFWALGMIFLEASTLLGSASVYTQRGLDWGSIYLRFDSLRKKYSPKLLCILSTLLHKDPSKRKEVFEIMKLENTENRSEEASFKDSFIASITEKLSSHATRLQSLNDKLSQLPLEEIRKNLQETKSKASVERKKAAFMEPKAPFTPNSQAFMGNAPDPRNDSLAAGEELVFTNSINTTGPISHRRTKSEFMCGEKTEKLLKESTIVASLMMTSAGETNLPLSSTKEMAGNNPSVKLSELFSKVNENAALLSPTYRENKFIAEKPKESNEITKMIDRSLERSRSARKLTEDRTEKMKKLYDKLSKVSLMPTEESLQASMKVEDRVQLPIKPNEEKLENKMPQEEYIIKPLEPKGSSSVVPIRSSSAIPQANSETSRLQINSNITQTDLLYQQIASQVINSELNPSPIGSKINMAPMPVGVGSQSRQDSLERGVSVGKDNSAKLTLREKILNKCWTSKGKDALHQMLEASIHNPNQQVLFKNFEKNNLSSLKDRTNEIDRMVEKTLLKSKEVIQKNLKINSRIRDASPDFSMNSSYRVVNDSCIDARKDARVSERTQIIAASKENRIFLEESIYQGKEDYRNKPPSFGIESGKPQIFQTYFQARK